MSVLREWWRKPAGQRRDDTTFLVLMLALSVHLAWPVYQATLVPCMDAPAHLALTEVMRHLGETGHLLDGVFRWGTFPAPNSAFYLLAYVGGTFVGPLAAERAVVILALVALPWAFCCFVTTFGRSRWITFAAFPMALQWPLTEGFVDYCLALPLVLVGLALVERRLCQPSRRLAALVVLAGGLLFLAHVQALLYFGIGAALLLAQHARARSGDRAGLWREGALVSALPASLVFLWLTRTLGEPGTTGSPRFPSLVTKLEELPALTLGTLEEWGASPFWIFAGGACLSALADSLIPAGATGVDRRRQRYPLLLLLVLSGAYLLAPLNLGAYYNLSSRLPSFLLIVASSLLVRADGRWRPLWRGLVVAAPLIVSTLVIGHAWQGAVRLWNSYATGFHPVLAAAPRQSRLLYLVEGEQRTGFRSSLWRHLPQYHTVVNEGVTSFSFGVHPGRLVATRDRSFDFEWASPDELQRLEGQRCYEVALHRGRPLEGRLSAPLAVIARRGAWTLYRLGPCDRPR